MRHALLLLSAACVCGFSSTANGQFTFTATSPTPAPQLYLAQTESPDQVNELKEQTQDLFGEEAKTSPFDFLSESQATEPSSLAPVAQPGSAPVDTSATHPVGLHHRQNAPAAGMIATGASAVPVNYMPPIDWNSQYRRAPNPTASYMMQQWCSDGLWDNYPAERAAQCAKQYSRIYQSHGHCNHCVMPGCAAGQCGHFHQHNGRAGACGCSAAPQCSSPAAAPATPCETDCAKVELPAPNGRPIPASTTQPATESDGKVAFFPQLFNR